MSLEIVPEGPRSQNRPAIFAAVVLMGAVRYRDMATVNFHNLTMFMPFLWLGELN
jgi:hypothetical protein